MAFIRDTVEEDVFPVSIRSCSATWRTASRWQTVLYCWSIERKTLLSGWRTYSWQLDADRTAVDDLCNWDAEWLCFDCVLLFTHDRWCSI